MAQSPVTLEFNPEELLGRSDPDGALETYYEVLRVENRKVNLVSRETIAAGLGLLAAESILPFEKISPESFHSYLDIGSGGGFPAIPIVLLRKVDQAILLERQSKKSLALERIVKALGLRERVHVEFSDLERYVPSVNFDLITLRLVRLTARVVRKVSSMLLSGGHFVYYSSLSEDFSAPDLTSLTYCYSAGKGALKKHFTVFTKK